MSTGSPGDYRVRLTVTDDSGTERNNASDMLRVLVNQAPIADAGRDQVGAPGQELSFSGSGSLDPDGDIAEYTWDFKDGTTATGERVTHRFERPGTYEVQPHRTGRYRPAERGRLRQGEGGDQRVAGGQGRAGRACSTGRQGGPSTAATPSTLMGALPATAGN